MRGAFQAILWDKDGTLVDSFAAWVQFERVLAGDLAGRYLPPGSASGYTARVLEELGVDRSGKVSSRGILATGTEASILGVFFQVLTEFGAASGSRESFLETAQSRMDVLADTHLTLPAAMPGAAAALEGFHTLGVPQGLATADTQTNAQRDLEHLGWASFFSFWACGGPHAKPDPWAVTEFAGRLGLSCREILVVGDTAADAAMAQAAGAEFVAVLCGTGTPAEFPPGTVLVEDPGSLFLQRSKLS
jgi:phosphoglycolate phosphatase